MNDSVLCPNCGAAVATYRNPLPTADIVAIRNNEVLLIRRRNPPEGWALPGDLSSTEKQRRRPQSESLGGNRASGDQLAAGRSLLRP